MFTALDCSSYLCFPMKPEAWPQRFLHSSHPLISPHDSIRWLEISIVQHRHFPKCPIFIACETKKPQSRLPGSLGNKPPPQILCTWHWPRQHVASVASKRCHTSAGRTRPQGFWKGWCSEAFQT